MDVLRVCHFLKITPTMLLKFDLAYYKNDMVFKIQKLLSTSKFVMDIVKIFIYLNKKMVKGLL